MSFVGGKSGVKYEAIPRGPDGRDEDPMNPRDQSQRHDAAAAALPWTLAAGLLFSLISISVFQGFLAIACALWILILVKDKKRIQFPAYFWALLVYAGLSLIASALSVNPQISFKDSRELLLFLIIPITCSALVSESARKKTSAAVLASGAVSIVYSLYHYFFKAQAGERIPGFMGHYMTQAGLLVLVCCLALGFLFFGRQKFRWVLAPGIALAALCLVLTMTRSGWIGFGAALAVVLALTRPKWLAILPVAAVLVFFLSPQPVKRRALSIFSLKSYSNAQRVQYLEAGIKIIAERPFFGTGPDTVDMVFQDPKYGLSEEAKRNVHLHNNFTQIAAERGLPALAAWLSFLIMASLALLKLTGRKSGRADLAPHAAAALAALLAVVISGFFEYNFGDSEIAMLFFYLISVPFAGRGKTTTDENNPPGLG